MSNSSILRNGTAPAGRTFFLAAGDVAYVLPAPAGRWLPSAVCQTYRAGCSYWSAALEQDACMSNREKCSLSVTGYASIVGEHS